MAREAQQITIERSRCSEIDVLIDFRNTVAIVDFLNLLRSPISNRFDAKFKTTEELISSVRDIALKLRSIGDFSKIYLVTKFFKFCGIDYSEILRIIIVTFVESVPEWSNKTFLVMSGQLDPQDKEADDRTLFILYNEFSKININSVILSNDNFDSIKSHYMRKVPISFYWIKSKPQDWDTAQISGPYKDTLGQSTDDCSKKYKVMHPINGEKDMIVIRS